MQYWFERLWPLVGAALASAGFYWGCNELPKVQELLTKLLDAALTVSATMLGFLLTITTIMNAVDTRRMRWVKDQGAYKLLEKYLRWSIWLNIAVISLALALPFIEVLATSPNRILLLRIGVVFLISWAWFASIRFSYLFIHLLGGGK